MTDIDPLVPVLAGLVVDIVAWLDAWGDDEVDPEPAAGMMDGAAGALGSLPSDQRARLVRVVNDLAEAEPDPRRRTLLRLFPFSVGLVED